MKKQNFKWHPLLFSLPFLFINSFSDQAGTFYPWRIRLFLLLRYTV